MNSGYNGARPDSVTGAYLLGNGYRGYSPGLGRFAAPDRMAPFGAGGVNSYGYCAGDPLNHADPSGHLSWQAGLGIGAGIVGLLGAFFTAGTSLVACGGVMAALESTSALSLLAGGAAAVADVTGMASAMLERVHPAASGILGWVSLAAGITSLGTGMGTPLSGIMRRGTASATLGLDDEIQQVRAIGRTPLRNGAATMAVRFDDVLPDGSRRLNIMAHGLPPTSLNACSRILIGNDRRGPSELEVMLACDGVNFSDYQRVRLLSCYSGDSYNQSFAYLFAARTGLPTTGFRGEVTVRGMALEAINQMASIVFARGEEEAMSRRIFDTAFGLYRAEMPVAVREGEGIFLRTVSDDPQINYLPVTWGWDPMAGRVKTLYRSETGV